MRTVFPTLNKINIGEPDANVEYINSLKLNSLPIYLSSYYMPESFPIEDFMDGQKFIVYGQKGTGKTVILRYIESLMRDSCKTYFVIFKRSFIDEADLESFNSMPLVIDEQKIADDKHYLHTIKRILILLLIKLSFEPEDADDTDIPTSDKGWIDKIRNSSMGDAISVAFDSVSSILSSMKIDMHNVSDNKVKIDAGKLLKKNNDDLLNYLIKRQTRLKRPLRLFIDEIHFSYRSKEALQRDAMLVRDCIQAIHNLNDRFTVEKVDLRIYNSVRSEYLEHPIINTADVNHSIESVGFLINWSMHRYDKKHPLFDLIYKRFNVSLGGDLTFVDFYRIYLKNIEPEVFLSRTWVKPRDFVRFFKAAKNMFPNKSQLTESDFNSVWRQYSQLSWSEVKSSASAFSRPESIELLESIFSILVPKIMDKLVILDYDAFKEILEPVYNDTKLENYSNHSFDHFMQLMYIIGIFGTIRQSADSSDIVQNYHRGNKSFHRDGTVRIHPAILKAFG